MKLLKKNIFYFTLAFNLFIACGSGFCLAPINLAGKQENLTDVFIIKKIGFFDQDENILNSHYDSYGYLVFEKLLKGKKDAKIKFTFENAQPFDIDGSIEDLIYYLENELNYTREDILNLEKFKIKEELRYLVVKRLVKYRTQALPYVNLLTKYLDEKVEPSPIVREELLVAIRMISNRYGTIEPGGKRLNISFLSYEAAPLIKKGGLGDVAGTLPRVLQNKRGHNVSVFMPFWSQIEKEIENNSELSLEKVNLDDFEIDGFKFQIYRVIVDSTPIYLLKNDDLFKVEKDADKRDIEKIRSDIYRKDLDMAFGKLLKQKKEIGELNDDEYGRSKYQIHPENAKRAIYFSRAGVTALKLISEQENVKPDIINTADWQTGLVPGLIKDIKEKGKDVLFKNVKVVHTIHNLSFKGLFNPKYWKWTSLDRKYFFPKDYQGAEFWGSASLMKLGIVSADQVTTVSGPYAEEIQTSEWGDGFEEIFKSNPPIGIINGISRRNLSFKVNRWIQRTDIAPDKNERELGVVNLMEGKEKNKEALREKYSLKKYPGKRVPLISYAARLSEQKGLNVLIPGIRELLNSGQEVQFIFAGEGDGKFENEMRNLMEEFPGDFVWTGKFEPEKEVIRILAGSDILAMPSLFEPCGITQLQAMRYGTIPIVNPVGGLIATVNDFVREKIKRSNKGNGYVISQGIKKELTFENLLNTFKRALNDFNDESTWNQNVIQTYQRSGEYSWENSSLEYERLFYKLIEYRAHFGEIKNQQPCLSAA